MAVSLLAVLAAGCGAGQGADGSASAPAGGSDPAQLAADVVGAGSLAEALVATREVLARAGIRPSEGGAISLQAAAPGGLVMPNEMLNMATQARSRETSGTLTLEEFGEMLADFGWPFLEESAPGEQLALLLREWSTAAQTEPDDPRAFAPLFVAEMARHQSPPVDILQEGYRPAELRLTSLELVVFATAFRTLDESGSTDQALRWFPQPGRAEASDMCTALKDWLGDQKEWSKVAADIVKWGAGQLTGKGLERGLQASGASPAQIANFSRAMGALDVANKLVRLAELYRSTDFRVEIMSDNPMHKPGPREAELLAGFAAVVGMSPEDVAEYERLAREQREHEPLTDCLGQLDLPMPPDLTEFTKDIDRGRITWRLVEGGGIHADVSERHNVFREGGRGQTRMSLDRTGPHSAQAILIVRLTPEQVQNHQGALREARVIARAELDTSQPPGIGTFLGASSGVGLAGSIVDLGIGWYQSFFQPRQYATLMVTYHAPDYWAFIGSYRSPYGDRPSLPVGGVSCSGSLEGSWAFYSAGFPGDLTADTLVSTMNAFRQSLLFTGTPGEPVEIVGESGFDGLYELLPGEPPRVRLTVTNRHRGGAVIDTGEFELFPIADRPDRCQRVR